MTALIFSAGDVRFKIDASVLGILRQHAQNGPGDLEAGGVLLGRRIRNTRDSVIDLVSVPMSHDERGRMFFNRLDPGHQVFMNEAWEASGGTTVYLGEWHTHPEHTPRPSETDLHDWRRRLACDDVTAPETFFVIVGESDVCAWLGCRKSGVIQQMHRGAHA